MVVVGICFIFFAGCCGSSDTDAATENTVGLNEDLFVDNMYGNVRISVDDVIRGSRANNIIAGSNMFNSEPDHGYEYLLVNIRIKNTGESSLSVYPTDFFPVYISGKRYKNQYLVLLDGYKKFKETELLPGGEVSAWIPYMVPTGSPAKLAYEGALVGGPMGYIRLS